ncbi:MAG TPA: hypothetical protein VGM51_13455 [Armatimonadota bacterium]|jgi:hypothetical protein
MRKYLLLLVAAAFIAAPRAAHAGYTAVTGVDAVLTPDTNGNHMADVGETFDTTPMPVRGGTSGTFTAFAPDGPTDPQINNADLGLYGYSLMGAVTAVNGTQVTYKGNYKIQYFDPSSAVFDVSTGTFSIDALFDANGGAALSGLLTQVAGPSNPAFADLSEGGQLVSYTGTYTPVVFGRDGVIKGTLRLPAGTAPIPEPSSLAFLATGLLPLLGIRRRK